MDLNHTFTSESRTTAGNSDNSFTTDMDITSGTYHTELNITTSVKSSSSEVELSITDYQQRSLLKQEITASTNRSFRTPLQDFANSMSRFRFRPSASRFSENDHSLAESDTACSKLSESCNILRMTDFLDRSSLHDAVSSKECLSVFGNSNSSEDLVGMKRESQPHRFHRRRSGVKKTSRLRNIDEHSSSGGSAKLCSMLPTVRRNRTYSDRSATIEKCRGDDENLENESSFRSHLQGTVGNRLISTTLPSTSTPTNLESRVHKRRTNEAPEGGALKRMKEDELMERGSGAASPMDVDIDVEMSPGQESLMEDEDIRLRSESGTPCSKENITSGRTSRASVYQRSVSSSVLEMNEGRDVRSPPGFLEVDYELEVVRNPDIPSSAFVSISARTLADLLNTISREEFLERYILVDCRYPFEYNGGHIRGALNLYNPADIEQFFYPDNMEERAKLMMKKPIFYCEFSQQRGPSMAHELRSYDRKVNFAIYPQVDYPEMYLLQYGYRNFFLQFCQSMPYLFEPFGYVKMKDREHQQELSTYKYHRTRTTASVYHSLMRDRYNRQYAERVEEEAGASGASQSHTPPSHIRRTVTSPESPSFFPDTPKCRPGMGRSRRQSVGNQRSRACSLKLWKLVTGVEDSDDPGPSTEDIS